MASQSVAALTQKMVQVTHIFACCHSKVRIIQASSASSNLSFSETACPARACQAIRLGELLKKRGLSEEDRRTCTEYVSSTVRTAIEHSNQILDRLGEVSPMLWDEMTDAALDTPMANVLKFAGSDQRDEYLDAWLGVAPLLQLISTFQGLCAVRAPTQHLKVVRDLIGDATTNLNCAASNLYHSSLYSRSACAETPLQYVEAKHGGYALSYEKSYGVQELKLLSSSASGQRILALPISKTNILMAHAHCVARAPSYHQELAMQAVAQGDAEELGATAIELSAIGTLDEDGAQLVQATCKDIRTISPARVLSTEMKAARQVLSVRISAKRRVLPGCIAVHGES